MSTRIVWQQPDGTLRITIPNELPLEGEQEAMHLDRVALRALNADPTLKECVRLADVEEADQPQSRRFRGCWRAADGRVVVDLPLAREQILAEVRAERNVRLTVSDGDKHRLDDAGTGEQLTALADYRQQLRDLPATVTSDLTKLETAEAMERYEPTWPVKPA